MKAKYFIKEIRKKKNITLRELERLTGISKSKLARIETFGGNVGVVDLMLIAKALNVDFFDICEVG